MAIDVAAASVRHERRVRIAFTNTLAAAAFTSTSYYRAACLNSVGTAPVVRAALVVTSSPNVVELQLDSDLVPGGIYQFFAEGVPAADASTTPVGASAYASFGERVDGSRTEQVTDLEALLYGIDLRYEGTDFLEDVNGDLGHLSGPPLVRRDLWNRLRSNGLPWDPEHGVHAREWIDAAGNSAFALRGRTTSQMLEDDRVRGCDATVTVDDDGTATVEVAPHLIGDPTASRVEPLRYEVQ